MLHAEPRPEDSKPRDDARKDMLTRGVLASMRVFCSGPVLYRQAFADICELTSHSSYGSC